MSFGKRTTSPLSSVGTTPFSTTWAGNRIVQSVGALAVIALMIGGYSYRVELLQRIYPRALITLTPTSHQQLRGNWRLDEEFTSATQFSIFWTEMQMAKLCGDAGNARKQQEILSFVSGNLPGAFAPEDMPNLYGPDRGITAQQAFSKIANRRDAFCRDEYPFAVYDGKVATTIIAETLARQAEQETKRLNYSVSVLRSLSGKLRRAGPSFTDDELTADERLMRGCMNEYAEALQIDACFRKARGEGATIEATWQPPQSAVATNIAAKVERSATTSYESPDVDIREHCRSVHGTNYKFQEMCQDEQEEARRDIAGMSVPVEIASHCDRIHADNYKFRKMCYEEQMDAKNRLSK